MIEEEMEACKEQYQHAQRCLAIHLRWTVGLGSQSRGH